MQSSGHIEVLRIGEPIAEMDLDMESWSPNEVVLFLAGEVPDIDENVLKSFADNKVSGDLLLDLDDDSLRELIPVLGDRIRVKKVIARVKASSGVCVTVISSTLIIKSNVGSYVGVYVCLYHVSYD